METTKVRAALFGIVLAAGLASGTARGDDDATSWARRARAHAEAGREAAALLAWERAYERDPALAEVREGLSRALAARAVKRLDGDAPADALRDASLAVELRPDDVEVRFLLAACAYRASDPALARAQVEAVVEADSKHAGAHELVGRLAYDAGQLDAAIASLERALELDGTRGAAKRLLDKARRERDAEARLSTLHSENFRVRYAPADAEIAERARDLLERAYNEVGASLGHHPRVQLEVVLYGADEFHRVTRTHGWVGAVFDGKIRIPLTAEIRRADELARTIRHEYTHACIASITRRCPAWLHEGLAQHFQGSTSDRAVLREAARAGALAPFESLSRGLTRLGDERRVRLAYEQALGFTEFLIGLRGPSEVTQVLFELGAGRDLDESLVRSYGEDLSALETRWRAAVAGE